MGYDALPALADGAGKVNNVNELMASQPRATGWLRARIRVRGSYPLIAVQATRAPRAEDQHAAAEQADAVEVARYAIALAQSLASAGAKLDRLDVSAQLRGPDPGPSAVVLQVSGEVHGLDAAAIAAQANAVLLECRAKGVWQHFAQAHVGLGTLPADGTLTAAPVQAQAAPHDQPQLPSLPRLSLPAPRLSVPRPTLRRPRFQARLPRLSFALPSIRPPRPRVRPPRLHAALRLSRPRPTWVRAGRRLAWASGVAFVLAAVALVVWAGALASLPANVEQAAGVQAPAAPVEESQPTPGEAPVATSVPTPAAEATPPAVTEAPAVPTQAPVAPTPPPVEATAAPAVPTVAPVLATQVPVAPTQAPAVPTEAPAEPTLAPAVPTAAPAAPTSVPLVPTPAQAAARPALTLVPWQASAPAWPNSQDSTAWLAADGYHLFARHSGQFVAVEVLPESLRDVTVMASFRKTGGPAGGGYGVIIRDQGPAPRDGLNQDGRYYVLEVGDKGEVGMWRREQNRWIDLQAWSPAPAVHVGNAENQLLVSARADQLTLSVNGTQVASASDTAFDAGRVGVFVGGDQNEAVLTRLTVLPAD